MRPTLPSAALREEIKERIENRKAKPPVAGYAASLDSWVNLSREHVLEIDKLKRQVNVARRAIDRCLTMVEQIRDTSFYTIPEEEYRLLEKTLRQISKPHNVRISDGGQKASD